MSSDMILEEKLFAFLEGVEEAQSLGAICAADSFANLARREIARTLQKMNKDDRVIRSLVSGKAFYKAVIVEPEPEPEVEEVEVHPEVLEELSVNEVIIVSAEERCEQVDIQLERDKTLMKFELDEKQKDIEEKLKNVRDKLKDLRREDSELGTMRFVRKKQIEDEIQQAQYEFGVLMVQKDKVIEDCQAKLKELENTALKRKAEIMEAGDEVHNG